MVAIDALAREIVERKAGQLAAALGKAQANEAFLRELVALCRHELVTHHGLHAHDGDAAHAWQLDTRGLIDRIDATLTALGAA